MHNAVILGAVRTPIGKRAGGLAGARPDDLLAHVLAEVMRRVELDPQELDEVVAGCANQAGEDNRNVARMATLLAGFPDHVPAFTINRLCASGLDAVVQATRAIWVGDQRLVVAAGVESMTRAPLVMPKSEQPFGTGNRTVYDSALGWRFPNPNLQARFPLESMGETAENLAERYHISRHEQDEFALASHEKALAAWQEGRFSPEVVGVEVKTKKASTRLERDEGPRADSSLEKLAKLSPAFRSGGTVTAGNSSSLNDGAAALVLASEQYARRLGVTPLARVVASGHVGVDPRYMGLGPVGATQKALARSGQRVDDIDLIELNEAFAAQSLAVIRELGVARERVNVNGGAVALGHPLGCSGARILTTLLHEMPRRGAGLGLATLCVGVGQGTSLLVGRPAW